MLLCCGFALVHIAAPIRSTTQSSAPSVVARVFSVTYNYFYLDLPYTTQLTTHISQHASKIITLLASKNLFAHLRMWVRAVRTPLSGCADGADAAVP